MATTGETASACRRPSRRSMLLLAAMLAPATARGQPATDGLSLRLDLAAGVRQTAVELDRAAPGAPGAADSADSADAWAIGVVDLPSAAAVRASVRDELAFAGFGAWAPPDADPPEATAVDFDLAGLQAAAELRPPAAPLSPTSGGLGSPQDLIPDRYRLDGVRDAAGRGGVSLRLAEGALLRGSGSPRSSLWGTDYAEVRLEGVLELTRQTSFSVGWQHLRPTRPEAILDSSLARDGLVLEIRLRF